MTKPTVATDYTPGQLEDMGETCECGHTEHWHANHGRGMCEFGGGCECATFWIDDGRDGPDTDRAYDEWHER